MENMGVLSAVNLLPSNKQQVQVFVSSLKNSIMEGEVDPLNLLVQLKMIEKTLEILKDKDVEKEILKNALNYHKDELADFKGCKLEVKETGVSYDYSVCDDIEIDKLYEQKKQLDDKIKEREAFLKNINGDVYGSDGVMLRKPIKKSTTKVVVTIK